MKPILLISTLAGGLALTAAIAQNPPATPATPQSNAASATTDSSGTSGDQVTKPAAAKGSTLMGCLAQRDSEGRYTLTNMQHRSGVQVVGPEDLKSAIGEKVKLTGKWEPVSNPTPDQQKNKETRRFQVTQVEVMSQNCQTPSAVTPVSKNKAAKK